MVEKMAAAEKNSDYNEGLTDKGFVAALAADAPITDCHVYKPSPVIPI